LIIPPDFLELHHRPGAHEYHSIVVRDRKNAMFKKTLLGANIGDVITSMIATASESGINVFEYFTTLQREAVQVKANPENYLPWNYRDNS
jgi:hypothetical protein